MTCNPLILKKIRDILNTDTNTSFTTGSILFAQSGSLAEDNSNLFWDDTNNRLGIGTGSPSNKLTLSGTNNTIALLSLKELATAGSRGTILEFINANNGSNDNMGTINFYGNTTVNSARISAIGTTSGSTGALQFFTSNSGTAGIAERMRISSSGVISFLSSSLDRLQITAGGTNTDISVASGNNLRFFGPANSSAVATGIIQFSTLSTHFTNSSGQAIFLGITPTVNSSGTAGNTDLLINRTQTATGSGNQNLIDTQVGGSSKWRTDNTGHAFYDATNTGAGTTGAQTINKPSGTVNFGAGATSLVVTNNLVSTSSLVFAVIRTNDATATIKNVVPSSGSFTITLNAGATAETSVGFFVIN